MTFEQWWKKIHFHDPAQKADMKAAFEACWGEAIANAFVEMHQMRKAVIDHYGKLPEFLDEFLKARIEAVTKNAQNYAQNS